MKSYLVTMLVFVVGLCLYTYIAMSGCQEVILPHLSGLAWLCQ